MPLYPWSEKWPAQSVALFGLSGNPPGLNAFRCPSKWTNWTGTIVNTTGQNIATPTANRCIRLYRLWLSHAALATGYIWVGWSSGQIIIRKYVAPTTSELMFCVEFGPSGIADAFQGSSFTIANFLGIDTTFSVFVQYSEEDWATIDDSL